MKERRVYMQDFSGSRKSKTALWGIAGIATVVLMWTTVAAGSGRPSSAREAQVGAQAPISQARSFLATWRKPAKLVPAGPAFRASVARGKTIGWVTVTNDIPFTQQMLSGARAAAKVLGFKIQLCNGKGQVTEWVRCYQQFIAQKVDIILSQSIDPRILKSSIAAANRANIPVITSSSNFSEAKKLWPGTRAEDSQPFRLVSQLMGASAVVQSNGRANALIITSNEVYVAPGQVKSIQSQFTKYCPSTCKSRVVNIAIADWQTKIPVAVQTAITADPDLNYIIPLYDGEVPFAVAGVHAANAEDRVRVISFNASPGVMDFLKKRDVHSANVGVWIVHHGWAAMDQAARVLAGQRNIPALRDPKLATRLFDYTNVDSLNFKSENTWYGKVNLAAFYKKQWRMK
jgi:ribose transport system substrate-binding protein